MAVRKNGNMSLDAAVALLIQNQAQFLVHLAEIRQTVARIDSQFETIKAVLVRHETTLEKLAEAVREKIGFKPS